MAGAGTTYFTQKRESYQSEVTAAQEQAQAAGVRLAAAQNALQILGKAQIAQSEAESLIEYYEQTQ